MIVTVSGEERRTIEIETVDVNVSGTVKTATAPEVHVHLTASEDPVHPTAPGPVTLVPGPALLTAGPVRGPRIDPVATSTVVGAPLRIRTGSTIVAATKMIRTDKKLPRWFRSLWTALRGNSSSRSREVSLRE